MKIQIIPSNVFACDLYREKRQKTWTQKSLLRGPPFSATQHTFTDNFLEAGTVLGAREIKTRWHPCPERSQAGKGNVLSLIMATKRERCRHNTLISSAVSRSGGNYNPY